MRKSASKSKRSKVVEEPEISEEENAEENGDGNGVGAEETKKESGSESEAEPEEKKPKEKKKAAAKSKKGKKGGRKPKKEEKPEDEEEEYEVEAIVDQRFMRGKRQFKVRWRGHSAAEDSWCGEADLHCEDLIKEYLDSVRDEEGESSGTTGKKQGGRKRKTAKDDESDEEEYEVERILEVKKKKNGDREFLIRWKGYSAADDTWEPEAHLSCHELIKKILAKADKAQESTDHELRTKPKQTARLTYKSPQSRSSRRIAKEGGRKTYYDDLE